MPILRITVCAYIGLAEYTRNYAWSVTSQASIATVRIELVSELAKICQDKTIAAILNRLGYKTGQEKTWNASRVAGLRGYHKIAPFQKQDDWVTQEEAARELQVSDTVVKRLIRERVLPAKQVVKFAPWIIEKNNLLLPAVQQQVKAARRGGHRLPQIVLGQGQLSLE
jgi:hypothetical protein